MPLTEPIEVTLLVTDTLEAMGLSYFIGGSLATAIHGVARAYDQEQLKRRVRTDLSEEPVRIACVASPEDIILAKLEWYQLGGEVSDRQWQDVLRVARSQVHSRRGRWLCEPPG